MHLATRRGVVRRRVAITVFKSRVRPEAKQTDSEFAEVASVVCRAAAGIINRREASRRHQRELRRAETRKGSAGDRAGKWQRSCFNAASHGLERRQAIPVDFVDGRSTLQQLRNKSWGAASADCSKQRGLAAAVCQRLVRREAILAQDPLNAFKAVRLDGSAH